MIGMLIFQFYSRSSYITVGSMGIDVRAFNSIVDLHGNPAAHSMSNPDAFNSIVDLRTLDSNAVETLKILFQFYSRSSYRGI